MSGANGKSSKRARNNYPGEVSFDAQKRSKEDEGSVAHISLRTDTGTEAGSEHDAEPQFLGSLGDELGEGSSVQQSAEEEFGEIAFLLGEPHDCIQTPTDAAVALLKQTESNPPKHSGQALAASCSACGRVPSLYASQEVGP